MTETEKKKLMEVIVQQHPGILYKVARTYCPVVSEQQDLVQEILLQIWKSLPRYDPHFALTTWLYRIALNTSISQYRKNARNRAANLSLDDHRVAHITVADSSDREASLQQLDQFISELNELDKALILLYLEDRSHAEIADILGISTSNVGTKTGRIKDKLKKRFSSFNT